MEMSVYRIHTDECLATILSLQDIIPLELIQFIIRLYWNLHSTPVLILRDVYYDMNSYEEGFYMKTAWYRGALGEGSEEASILYKISQIRPDIRFYEIIYTLSPERQILFREIEYSPGIWFRYGVGSRKIIRNAFPIYIGPLLIPGPSWDQNMLHPGFVIDIDKIGIQTLSHKLGTRSYSNRTLRYVEWFTDALNNPEFIAVQNKLL
jgi:hypothetical protein